METTQHGGGMYRNKTRDVVVSTRGKRKMSFRQWPFARDPNGWPGWAGTGLSDASWDELGWENGPLVTLCLSTSSSCAKWTVA